MKLKTKRDLSYINPLTVEFFQNNGTGSISITLLTNRRTEAWTDRWTEGRTNGREINTSLAEVKNKLQCFFVKYVKRINTLHRAVPKGFSVILHFLGIFGCVFCSHISPVIVYFLKYSRKCINVKSSLSRGYN